MDSKETTPGSNDPSRRNSLTDAEALDLIAEAEAEYEAYVALSKIPAHRVSAEKIYEPKYDWSTPMTLVTY